MKGEYILAGAEGYTTDTLAGEGMRGWGEQDRHQHESPGISLKLECPVVVL